MTGHIHKMRLFALLAMAATLALSHIAIGQPSTQMPIQVRAAKPKQDAANDQRILTERARSAENRGDYARALTIWRELLVRSPWNAEALQGIPRALIVLKQYDEAEMFLGEWIGRCAFRDIVPLPGDPTSAYSLKLMLGQVALAREDTVRAWSTWNGALAEANRLPDAMRALVIMLQQNRLWEDSEGLIREYRKESKQPAFMALELAGSLRAQMNWMAATEELLLYAGSNPSGWQTASNQLDRFPDDSLVIEKVRAVLRKAVQRERKDATLWRMYASYLHKTGDLEAFFSATVTADSLSQAAGMQLLSAAQQLLGEGEIELARRGFQAALARKPTPEGAAKAELGLARCLEALGQWAEAKASYEAFIAQRPQAREVEEAKFRIASILLEHDSDAAGALEMFRALWMRPQTTARAQVGLRIGDCHAWMGHYDDAIAAWSDVVRLGGAALTEDATHALLRTARANLWRDSTKLALAALDSITSGNPLNTPFNDAVLYTALLGEGGVYRAQRAFSDGDFAAFRGEDSVAAVRFDSAANLLKYGRLAEWARFSQALALRASRQPQAAIAALDSFIARFPESVDLDRAKYTRAVIRTDDLHDDRAALTELESLLRDHPRSMYLEQARRKARILSARVS